MENINEVIKNPYSNIKISLLISSKSYEDFFKLYNNLILVSNDIKHSR